MNYIDMLVLGFVLSVCEKQYHIDVRWINYVDFWRKINNYVMLSVDLFNLFLYWVCFRDHLELPEWQANPAEQVNLDHQVSPGNQEHQELG